MKETLTKKTCQRKEEEEEDNDDDDDEIERGRNTERGKMGKKGNSTSTALEVLQSCVAFECLED